MHYSYNGNLEWSLTIRDLEYGPVMTQGPQDLQYIAQQIAAMKAAPLGEGEARYDARAVFDSRPLNSFDGVFSGDASAEDGVAWTVLFQCPMGYRAVVREVQVNYDAPGSGPASNSVISLLYQDSAVPFNSDIIIGAGTSDPLETFYLVEEGSSFGVTGTSSNITATTAYVNMRVNLIPVDLSQLSFTVVNRKPN